MPYKDPQKRREYIEKWRQENPDYDQQRHQANRESILARQADYRKKNRETIRAKAAEKRKEFRQEGGHHQDLVNMYDSDNLDLLVFDCQDEGNGIPDLFVIHDEGYRWVEVKSRPNTNLIPSSFEKTQLTKIRELIDDKEDVHVIVGNINGYKEYCTQEVMELLY